MAKYIVIDLNIAEAFTYKVKMEDAVKQLNLIGIGIKNEYKSRQTCTE